MSRLGRRWLVTGVLWGVVLTISGWNLHLVSQIQNRRQALETIRMDQGYLKQNAAGIDLVLEQQSRLVHRVKSFGLGFLVVENDLKRLSWELGLQQMYVDAKNDYPDTRPVPVNVVAEGPVPALVQWLATVEEAYPYLKIERMEIAVEHKRRMGKLRVTFIYRYALALSDKDGTL